MQRRNPFNTLLITGWIVLGGCAGFDQKSNDNQNHSQDGGEPYQATFTKPVGFASVTFFVDDTANQTYESKEIQWVGSFRYDVVTNIIVYDPNWNLTLRSYPALYDDGPIAEGGHEMPGAIAFDHIFSTEVYVKADANKETVFSYGAATAEGDWIWNGRLGRLSLPAESQERIDANGFFIHSFGTYDLRITLDTNRLHPAWNFEEQNDRVFMEGSMNNFRRIELFDDGSAESGDESPNDGIYTYQHSLNLGEHDGLLYGEQLVQFAFLINQKYYRTSEVVPIGIEAQTTCSGHFGSEVIFMEYDSLGLFLNPSIRICGTPTVPIDRIIPDRAPTAGSTAITIYGDGFSDQSRVEIAGKPAQIIEIVDDKQINCLTPSAPPGPAPLRVSLPSGEYGELSEGLVFFEKPALELRSFRPQQGPSTGDTLVTLFGRGFSAKTAILFGESSASQITWHSPEKITCHSPAQSVGEVKLRATNPDGSLQSADLTFTYRDDIPRAAWARLLPPYSIMSVQGQISKTLQSELVFESATSDCNGAALVAELGIGPTDSDPRQQPKDWTWFEAGCSSGIGGSIRYEASPVVQQSGRWAFTFRFSLDRGASYLYADGPSGTHDGLQIDQLGELLVVPEGFTPTVVSIEPIFGSSTHATSVLLRGTGYDSQLSVSLDGNPVETLLVNEQELTLWTAPHAPGSVDLAMSYPNQNDILSLSRAFIYVLKASPTIDGVIQLGPDLEWNPVHHLSQQQEPTHHTWGNNRLQDLFVGYDQDNLYVALQAWTDSTSGNSLVVYLDTDFGSQTGVSDMNQLIDHVGLSGVAGLDDAISSICTVHHKGFGADFAIGTQNLVSIELQENQLDQKVHAGLRSLADPASFIWLPATIKTSKFQGQVEMAIPWSSLYGASLPQHARLALFARLVSGDGEYVCPATMPPDDPIEPERVKSIAIIDVYH